MIEGAGRAPSRPPLPIALAARLERGVDALRRAGRRALKRRRGEPIEILVELGWRLGDEVMALPVYQALHRGPGRVAVTARVRYPELLVGNPWVRSVNPAQVRYDRRIELRGEERGRTRRETLARQAGVSLDGILPVVYLGGEERERTPLPELDGLARPRVAVHAAATQPCKEWGREHWLEVARRLERAGASIVEVGSERAPLGAGLSLLGRTSVRELARVLAQVDLVIGDDSGPIHLALACGTPAVAVFGATDPALLHAPDPRLSARASTAACRFCWPRHELAWPSGVCPRPRHECMEAISAEDVARAALARLEGKVLPSA